MTVRRALFPLALLALARAFFASKAHAQAPHPSAQEILELRAAAERQEREKQYAACAFTYSQLHEKHPDAPASDAVLYNVGVCYELASMARDAIEAFARVEERYPHSPLAPKALVRRGTIAASIAEYAEAATAFESYAKRNGGEKDAPLALNRAIRYRIALGETRQALAGFERFLRSYGKRRNLEAASALLAMASLFEEEGNPKQAIKTYRRYLAEVGGKGGADRLLEVHARLGVQLWQQSCPALDELGLCLRAAPRASKVQRCSARPSTSLQRTARRLSVTREARKHLTMAVTLGNRGAFDHAPVDERRASATFWFEAARFFLLEEGTEEFLGADHGSPDQDLDRWMGERQASARALIKGYGKVDRPSSQQAEWAIASAARIGQISYGLASSLQGAPIPKHLRGRANEAERNEYCHAIHTNAAPLEDVAGSAFAFCLDASAKRNWIGTWSRMCERGASRLRPEQFPPRAEVRGKANGFNVRIATEDGIARATTQ